LKNELKTAIENALKPDEELLWAGMPGPWAASKSSMFLLLFAIPWTLFSIAWEAFAIWGFFHGGAPGGGPQLFLIVFPLFGLPFVLVGLAMLASPYYAYKNAQRTVYVITASRILSININWPWNTQHITSHDAGSFDHVELSLKADQTGDVKVVFGYSRDSDGDRVEKNFIFYGVRDARAVETILTEKFGSKKKIE